MRTTVILLFGLVLFGCKNGQEPNTVSIDYMSLGNSPPPSGTHTSVLIPVNKLKQFPTGEKNHYAVTYEEVDAYARHDFSVNPHFDYSNFKAPTKEEIDRCIACGLNCGDSYIVVTNIPTGYTCGFSNGCLTITGGGTQRQVCCGS